MTIPFRYPSAPHRRRHGPKGYQDYRSYRPWLRDEFTFRCVFCLRREVWSPLVGEFAVHHFEPVKTRPDRGTDYDNLLYVCTGCNLRKYDRIVPDPLTELVEAAVEVLAGGEIVSYTNDARRSIAALQLDSPELNEYRSLLIDLIRLAANHDLELYRRLLGFPIDLPDLSQLKPPDGNARPDGVEQSHFGRRTRGELAEIDSGG